MIQEARYIDATGAGITGGDPLLVWKRVETYISLLKNTFGDSFHIHMYTSGLKNTEYIPDLIKAGLDEIRFHPAPKFWNDLDKSYLKKCMIISRQIAVGLLVIWLRLLPHYQIYQEFSQRGENQVQVL